MKAKADALGSRQSRDDATQAESRRRHGGLSVVTFAGRGNQLVATFVFPGSTKSEGYCYGAEPCQRLIGPGWEVRVWANPGGVVRIARFPVEGDEDAAYDLADSIRLFVQNGGDLLSKMPGGGEEPS
jgi:hypothetical protein